VGATGVIEIVDALRGDAGPTLAQDARDGLTRAHKELSPKHLYDSRGAALFDEICELEEYYPTRTERLILERHAGEIAAASGAAELVELGSGSAVKTRLLLDAMAAAGTLARYVPLDVTERVVRESAAQLSAAYPGMDVHGVVGDFLRHLDRLPPPAGPRLVAFIGGTIGNFRPDERRELLRTIAAALGPGGHLLLGTDLVKDRATLEAAYNDARGVSAQFNKNILLVLNRELGARFDPARFDYLATFDAENEWIDIRLRSRAAQDVEVPGIGIVVHLDAGEEIRTEISAKFTRARAWAELRDAGLEPVAWYADPREWFALTLARAA
jgi:L-histidine Nalpha-methyltransferase